jgi:hypothetical protein
MKNRDPRAIAESYCRALPADFDVLGSLQHDDFVQEFPQSGEVIRGRENFRRAHENYPGGTPLNEVQQLTGTEDRWVMAPTFTFVRLVGGGDTFVAESKARYPDGSDYHVITIIEITDAKVLRARTYFAAPFEAPAWRAGWTETQT